MQGGFVVATMVAAAGLFSCAQRRDARVAREADIARQAALDSIVAAAQERANELDGVASPSNPNAIEVRSSLPAPIVDTSAVLSALAARGASTYLDEILNSHDGMHFRWPDRTGDPMRIWVQELDERGFDRAFPQLVRDAFSDWGGLGLPFHFTFVRDSARAEIHVTWIDRYPTQMTGKTRWEHDRHGWIVGGTIEIARHQPDGRALDRDAVRAIALHEVGHLIGLDHTTDITSIMSPTIHVSTLSEADRRTARLAYDLPPGMLPRNE